MKKFKTSNSFNAGKMLIVAIIAFIAISIALVIFGIAKESPESPNISVEIVNSFQSELTDRALKQGLHPIEGFDAFIFLETFPKLEKKDFDGVQTGIMHEEGIYTYRGNKLEWQRTGGQPITSAEKTISKNGYETLLKNLSERLGIPVTNEKEAIAIIDAIYTRSDIPSDIADHIASKKDLILIEKPQPLSVITSPLTVRGKARGSWFFEADFPIFLVDWDGRIIAESYASAVLDPNDPTSTWMTEDFVSFEGTLQFENPSFPDSVENSFSRRGTVIFQKDNPSGLSEHDDALEIPVWFELKKS